MPVNVVLIDFESVQPESLAALDKDHFKVLVFIGANQSKVPFEVAATMQALGTRAEYVRIAGDGRNALDFHIAYYIGHLAAADPAACFRIISKDKGYDPLIHHLRARKTVVTRSETIDDIPDLKVRVLTSHEERLESVIDRLQRNRTARPRTPKTLSSSVAALFQKSLPDEEVAALVKALQDRGLIVIADNKVTYALPSTG